MSLQHSIESHSVEQPVKILAFAGSLRAASHNKRLVKIAAAAAERAGGQVTLIDLKEYPLPVFDEDLESRGTPAEAQQLRQLFIDHDGLLISSPEYNSSITAALKNAIDWVSRPGPGQPSLAGFHGKVAALVSASPGALGGLRGLVHLRQILGNIGVLVLPEQQAVSRAHEAFTAEEQLKDDRHQAQIESIAKKLVETLTKLKA